MKEVIVSNDLAAVKHAESAVLEEAARRGICENTAFAIKLALEEAFTNDFRHGNKCDPDKHIIVRYEVTSEHIEIEVEDEGDGFDPDQVPDPTQPEFIDRPHGRGIMLMRAYLDVVEYNASGNAVRLLKRER